MPGSGWNGVQFPQWCISQFGKKSGKVQTSCTPWAMLKSGMASFSPSASELWPFRTRGKPGFPFGQKSPFFPDLCGQAEDPHETLGDIEGKTKIPYWLTSAIIILLSLSYSICHHYIIIIYRHLLSSDLQGPSTTRRRSEASWVPGWCGRPSGVSASALACPHDLWARRRTRSWMDGPGRPLGIVESPEATYTSNVDVWYIHIYIYTYIHR